MRPRVSRPHLLSSVPFVEPRGASLAVVLLASAALGAQPPPGPIAPRDAGPVAIADVTAIDVERGTRRPRRTVLVRDDMIAVVGLASRTRVPAAARVVDGHGRHRILGRWDMHVHTLVGIRPSTDLAPTFLPRFVANGVTGVRDTATDLELLRRECARADSMRRA